MSESKECTPADAALAARLAAFFRAGADPWERLEVPLPPQVFGLASNRAFARYLEGNSRVPVRSVDELCAWLRGCETIADTSLFCEADFWQHPVTFEQVRKGDCEDHALWAWRQLRALGFPTLFVTGLWCGIPHAWVVWSDPGGEHILECTSKKGPMDLSLAGCQAEYRPALAVDEHLRTFVFQGYPDFHAAQRRNPVSTRIPEIAIAILTGGRSSRMGRDKARVRVAGRSLLGHVRAAATPLGRPIQVIRRDRVPDCGPVGGILTGLERVESVGGEGAGVLFLSCDMPAVTTGLLARFAQAPGPRTAAVFAEAGGRIGFPVFVATRALPAIRAFLARGRRSLQELARTLKARRLRIPARDLPQLVNLNTPADLAEYRLRLRNRRARQPDRPRPRPAAPSRARNLPSPRRRRPNRPSR